MHQCEWQFLHLVIVHFLSWMHQPVNNTKLPANERSVVICTVVAVGWWITGDNIYGCCHSRERIEHACCMNLHFPSPPSPASQGKGSLWLEEGEWEKMRAKMKLTKSSSWQEHNSLRRGHRGLEGPKCLSGALAVNHTSFSSNYLSTCQELLRLLWTTQQNTD